MTELKGIKVCLVSLGCDKNLVDSEAMLGQLGLAGCLFTGDMSEAAAIIINTCGFLQDAIIESELSIAAAVSQKKDGRCRAVIVTGCAAERYKERFASKSLDIDGILGVNEYDKIVGVLSQAFDKNMDAYVDFSAQDPHRIDENIHLQRILSTPKHYAYLKIAEGCDKSCTYCVIPKIRGHFRSRTMDSLLEEARMLAGLGVRELILVAQDTTLYGTDIYGKQQLHILLSELAKIEGMRWLRLLYCYPEHIYDELINEMETNPKILHYMDMPIQHASDRILKLMGRNSSREKISAVIAKLRDAMPDIVLRTTLIAGFPGESKEDFMSLCGFVKEARFERLGVFAYSREENTPADLLPDHLSQKTKDARKNRLMAIQQEISHVALEQKIGSRMEIVVEGISSLDGDALYFGRGYADAPQIDGLVYFSSDQKLMAGDFVSIEIKDALDYDLVGVVV